MRSAERVESLSKSFRSDLEVNGMSYSLNCLTSSVGFLLRASYLQLREILRTVDGVDIKPAMFELLKIASENPGMLQAHAARILLIQESNMATLVREALKLHLISRSDGKGRSRQGLWLTPLGEATVVKMAAIAEEVTENYLEGIGADENAMLKHLLGKLYLYGLERKAEVGTVSDD